MLRRATPFADRSRRGCPRVDVVTGYKANTVNFPGINTVENPAYDFRRGRLACLRERRPKANARQLRGLCSVVIPNQLLLRVDIAVDD